MGCHSERPQCRDPVIILNLANTYALILNKKIYMYSLTAQNQETYGHIYYNWKKEQSYNLLRIYRFLDSTILVTINCYRNVDLTYLRILLRTTLTSFPLLFSPRLLPFPETQPPQHFPHLPSFQLLLPHPFCT